MLQGFRIMENLLEWPVDFTKQDQIWNGIDNSDAKSSFEFKVMGFPGHLDVIEPSWVKKLKILSNFREKRWDHMFEIMMKEGLDIWLVQNIAPPCSGSKCFDF